MFLSPYPKVRTTVPLDRKCWEKSLSLREIKYWSTSLMYKPAILTDLCWATNKNTNRQESTWQPLFVHTSVVTTEMLFSRLINHLFHNAMKMMSMGWDYISELLPPKGLLFIPKVMYKHGEPWLNDTDKGKKTPDSSTRALWQSYHQSSTSKAEGNEFGLIRYLCSYFERIFNMP
jgi:hypothetical protein